MVNPDFALHRCNWTRSTAQIDPTALQRRRGWFSQWKSTGIVLGKHREAMKGSYEGNMWVFRFSSENCFRTWPGFKRYIHIPSVSQKVLEISCNRSGADTEGEWGILMLAMWLGEKHRIIINSNATWIDSKSSGNVIINIINSLC